MMVCLLLAQGEKKSGTIMPLENTSKTERENGCRNLRGNRKREGEKSSPQPSSRREKNRSGKAHGNRTKYVPAVPPALKKKGVDCGSEKGGGSPLAGGN